MNGFTKEEIKEIKKRSKEAKSGRTYMMSCHHNKHKGFFVCMNCVVKECKKWYAFGRKDERVSGD